MQIVFWNDLVIGAVVPAVGKLLVLGRMAARAGARWHKNRDSEVAIEQGRVVIIHVEYVFVVYCHRGIGLDGMTVDTRDTHMSVTTILPVADDAGVHVTVAGDAVPARLGQTTCHGDRLDVTEAPRV